VSSVGEPEKNDGLGGVPEQRFGDAQMKMDDGDLREEVLGDVLALDKGGDHAATDFHGGGGLGGEREYGLEDADHRKKNRELKGGLTMRK
jgi:hypothetical protein